MTNYLETVELKITKKKNRLIKSYRWWSISVPSHNFDRSNLKNYELHSHLLWNIWKKWIIPLLLVFFEFFLFSFYFTSYDFSWLGLPQGKKWSWNIMSAFEWRVNLSSNFCLILALNYYEVGLIKCSVILSFKITGKWFLGEP